MKSGKKTTYNNNKSNVTVCAQANQKKEWNENELYFIEWDFKQTNWMI